MFLEIIKPNVNINFMDNAKKFFIISGALCILGLILMFGKGFNLGIDFAGGTVIQAKFSKSPEINTIREAVGSLKFGDLKIGEVSVQNFGEPDEILIRVGKSGNVELDKLAKSIEVKLKDTYKDRTIVIQRVEQVGPQVGSELRNKALMALIFANIGVLIYVAIRFEFIYAVGAILALVHDCIITLGFVSFFGKEVNLTIVAAILTLIGYSLNDTIVVFDRIREKLKTGLENIPLKDILNKSINETLSRTLLTSFLTFMSVFALLIFGGEVINGFAFSLTIGIIVGTYSSIGIASALVFVFKSKYAKQDVVKKK